MELCVNYKGAEADWAGDMAYFRSVGVTGIRPHLPAIPSPWAIGTDTPGSFAYWRRLAKTWSDAGFYVTWGIAGLSGFNTGGALTATAFNTYRTVILSEAAYLQAQGINITFEIGNEMESEADGTTLTKAQLIANLGTLATDVKAVYTLGKVGYSPYDQGGNTYDLWISTGRGGLDYINVHPYCNAVSGLRSVTVGAYSAVAKMAKAFGPDHIEATEWGMEAGETNVAALPVYLKQAKIMELWNYMQTLGIKRAFVYSYRGYLDANNDFAMKLTDGSFDPQWAAYLAKGRRFNRT